MSWLSVISSDETARILCTTAQKLYCNRFRQSGEKLWPIDACPMLHAELCWEVPSQRPRSAPRPPHDRAKPRFCHSPRPEEAAGSCRDPASRSRIPAQVLFRAIRATESTVSRASPIAPTRAVRTDSCRRNGRKIGKTECRERGGQEVY